MFRDLMPAATQLLEVTWVLSRAAVERDRFGSISAEAALLDKEFYFFFFFRA